MDDLLIRNATVVLPEGVLEGGAVVVRNGVIAEVAGEASAVDMRADAEIDADGAYLLPGIVDLHNDSLEFEINPRPQANFPLPLAFANAERRLIAAGVTTEFHAIAFMDRVAAQRTVVGAAGRGAYVAELQRRGCQTIDHHVLHRIDVWSPEHLDLVFESLQRLPVRYVTLNDHTPGQGQYSSVEKHVERMREYAAIRGTAQPDVDDLHRRIAVRASDTWTVPQVYARVRDEAARRPMVIGTHDDDTPAKVDAQYAIGASIAEFPVTLDAAYRARERGMAIVVGAPNIVRGGSQSGNLDASELFARGLADIICADYHAPSLLSAAFRLVRDGYLDRPAAIRTITLNPARAVGLTDRGAIEPGLRADLILVRENEDGVPCVEAVFCLGRLVFQMGLRVRVQC